jgi:hypothetical protein
MRHGRYVEKVILLLLAVGAVYFVAFTVYSDFKSTKERTLYYQLQILRMGVNIFQLVNHRNPRSLGDLLTRTYELPSDASDRHFVNGVILDPSGRVFDPFGNPYFYDPITGWVRSVSSGYEFW